MLQDLQKEKFLRLAQKGSAGQRNHDWYKYKEGDKHMRSIRKVKKSSIGRRLFAFGLAGLIVLQGIPVSAKQSYKKSYSVNGITYHDIYDGKTTGRGEDETDDAIAAVTYDGALEAWAKAAANVFASDKNYYFPYKGKSFDTSFGQKGKYVYVVGALGNSGRNLGVDNNITCPLKINTAYKNMDGDSKKEPKTQTGHDGNTKDRIMRTGLQVANSRNSALKAMMQLMKNMREGKMDADRMLDRNYIPALDNSDKDTVLYTFVGCNQQVGGTLKYEYNVFGLVFYDFQYCPIPNEDVTYFTDETNQVMENPSKYLVEDGLNRSIDGLGYTFHDDSEIDITSLDNSKSGTANTLTLSKSDSTTETMSNTFSKSETISYGQSITNTFNFGKNDAFFKDSLSIGFTFSEAYQSAFSETKTVSKTESDTSSASYQVPAYSIMSVSSDKTTQKVNIKYKNAVAMSYKVAIVGMNGTYYCDAGNLDLKGYTQNQICTIFGSANRQGENVDSTEDAITNMIKRYKKAKKDGNNANEENYYTLATKQYSKSIHEKNVSNNKKDNWLTNTPVVDWKNMEVMYKPFSDLNNTMDTKYHVMNVAGATIDGTAEVTKYTVSAPALCQPLNQTKAYMDNNLHTVVTSKNISVDDNINLSDFTVAGFFKNGTKFPLDSTKGKWVMVDDDGNEIEDSDVATLKKNAGKSLVLTPKKTGKVNLLYMIDEGDNAYYYLDTKNGNANTKITNDSLQSSAMIEVTIHSNAASAAAASIFAGENTAGVAAVVCVLILIVAGTGFVIYKKRKKGLKKA